MANTGKAYIVMAYKVTDSDHPEKFTATGMFSPAQMRTAAEFDESLHPRDEQGRWTDGMQDVAANAADMALRMQADHGVEQIQRLSDKIRESGNVMVEVPAQDDEDIESIPPEWSDLPSDVQNTVYDHWTQQQYENGVDVDSSGIIKAMEDNLRQDNEAFLKATETQTLNDLSKAFPDTEATLPLSPIDPANLGVEAIAGATTLGLTPEQLTNGININNEAGTTTSFNLYHQLDPETLITDGEDDGEGTSIDEEALRFTDGSELTAEQKQLVQDTWNDHYNENMSEAIDRITESDSYYEELSTLEQEQVSQEWHDLSDEDKISAAQEISGTKHGGFDLGDYYKTPEGLPQTLSGITLPQTWEIAHEPGNGNENYNNTRQAALALVGMRYRELEAERGKISGLGSDETKPTPNPWPSWKVSSTSSGGNALQVAAMQEFMGHNRGIDEQRAIRIYEEAHGEGSFEALKTYARAQWEVTQFLLRKSGTTDMESYRAILFPKTDVAKEVVEPVGKNGEGNATHELLPNAKLERNGAASATMDVSVANSWNGVDLPHPRNYYDRVVYRLKTPNTSVLSLPVFGQNVHGEREVVLIGSRGKWKWDAFKTTAPTINHMPIGTKGKN